MSEFKEFRITEKLKGMRLDVALAHFLDSRTKALWLIKQGYVTVQNQKKIKPSYKVNKNDLIILDNKDGNAFEEKEPFVLEPYDFHIPVVYEDDQLLVVNKPAGLVVHPGVGHKKKTLVNALIHKLNPEVGSNERRPGLVHRLDKEVSGLLVLSKTHTAHHFLSKQFTTRQIKRKYLALCYNPIRYDKGQIETYIMRHPKDRKKFISNSKEGKKCITLFRVVQRLSEDLSLVEFELLTGRTHQARIHSLEISRGIIGDEVYSPLKPKKVKDSDLFVKLQTLNRVGLHAFELTFIHPQTKERVEFECPLPQKLKEIIEMK